MDAMSRGELLPKVVEAYSRPTRIVRGKDVEADMEVFVTFCLLNLIRNLFLRTWKLSGFRCLAWLRLMGCALTCLIFIEENGRIVVGY